MSPATSAAYDRWFATADADSDGRVTGKDAVTFFQRSGLPREVLSKVWELSNTQRLGYLDKPSFHKAMELIAIAQSGKELSRESYDAARAADDGIPLPRMEGIDAETGYLDGQAPGPPGAGVQPSPSGTWAAPGASSSSAAGEAPKPSGGIFGRKQKLVPAKVR